MNQTVVSSLPPERLVVSLYCACHGTVKMGEVINGRLVGKDKRHGQSHMLVLDKIPTSGLSLAITTE